MEFELRIVRNNPLTGESDLEEALRTFTVDGTWLTREEAIKGSIEVGKLADMAVLDRDYFAVPEEEIKDLQVNTTIVGGQVVWQRE